MPSYFYYMVIIVRILMLTVRNGNEGMNKRIISKQSKNNTQVLEDD
jgi:uncharacterized membrane protein